MRSHTRYDSLGTFLGADSLVGGVVDNKTEDAEVKDYFEKCSTFFGIRLVLWCSITAFVHVILAGVTGVLILLQERGEIHPTRLITPLTRTVGVWVNSNASLQHSSPGHNGIELYSGCEAVSSWGAVQGSYRVEPLVLDAGKLDTRWFIFAFFILSALSQLMNVFNGEVEYNQVIINGNNHLSHFAEYSISASILVLVISVQLGVTDYMTLISVMCNNWCCMIFGLLAELLHQHESEVCGKACMSVFVLGFDIRYYLIAHVAGWISVSVALFVAFSNMINFEMCVVKKVSDVFWDIGKAAAYIEAGLFIMFGFVQTMSMVFKPCNDGKGLSASNGKQRMRWACRVEFSFIILSLTAKAVLGIMVYSANLV
jgi:hypothetical protein